MKSEVRDFNKFYSGIVAMIASVIVSGYWILGYTIDVYKYAFVGAIYEILWLFMVLFLFAIPLLSLTALIINRFTKYIFYVLSILLNLGTFFWMVYR